jgi:AraC-like DNA-binding protein
VDVLSEVIAVAGVQGTVAARVDAAEPWGLQLDEVPGAAFHTLTSGTAWLRVPGQPAVHLAPGDVVLLANGAEHGLASDVDGPLSAFDHLAAEQALQVGGVMRVGTGEVRTRILCASYRQDPAMSTQLLSLLPDVLHIPAGSLHRGIEDTVRLMSIELADPQPAAATMLNRLVDVLLIHLVRARMRDQGSSGATSSWLTGLGDPVVAAALQAIHARPERGWTMDLLASEASVSRATLARRFPALVGDTPAAYLTRWRMDLAARQLRDTDRPLDAIARSVGYTSEYAFSRAFSRARSVPPGRYRNHSRQADHELDPSAGSRRRSLR